MRPTARSYRLLTIQEMQRPLVIMAATALVIIVVGLFTIHLHHENKKEILSQLRRHQLSHAQNLAKQIESFFGNYSQILQGLSSFGSFQQDSIKGRIAYIQASFKQQEKAIIKSSSLYDEFGTITYSTEEKMIGLNGSQSDFFSWAKKVGSKGKVFVSPPIFESGSPRFLLATPLYRDASKTRHSNPDGNFAGVLSLIIDLKEFLASQLYFSAPKVKLHQVWIMDRDGKLLFQSEHPEMVSRNIYQKGETCKQCHPSFHFADDILRQKEGAIDYEVRNFSRKIAAFAPMDFENMSWVVVVNSVYDEVVTVAKKSFREHLMLLGIVVLALVGASWLIVRSEQLKVRAQEKAKHRQEKRALEDEMQHSEAQYEAIIETAHDAIGVLDTEGNFIFLNKTGEQMSGYTLSELAGKNFAPLIHPEDLARVKDLFLRTLEGKPYGADFEARICAKDGKTRLLSLNSVPLYKNGEVIGLSCVGRDITEYRKAENALRESEKQLRYLSSQILMAEETERRRISKELHDELGGALSVLKLRLSFIGKKLESDPVTVREECETISQEIDQVIEDVRRLSRDLTPSILQDAGLLPAIRWLITNYKKNYEIEMTLDVVDIDHLFPQDAQIIIYRVLQEALTNIGRHAQAKSVSIMIKKHDGGVSFSVEDDGIGFDVPGATGVNPDERGLGLAIMGERARMLGGSFELWSEKGKGTRISFHIPLEKGESV